jgi:hypothetical protein
LTSTQGGLRKVDLTPPAPGNLYNVTTPTFIPDGQQILGVLTVPPQAVGAAPEFYVSVSSGSRIYHLQYDVATIIETLGRPIYNPSEPVAINAMIGQPEGMVQDPLTSNTYFFDSGNDVIREVSGSGTNPITLLSGTPGVAKAQDNSGLPLNQALYDGVPAFNSGGAYPLVGVFSPDGKTKTLYFGEATAGTVQSLDLIGNIVQTIAGVFSSGKASQASIDSWRIQALAIAKQNSGLEILNFRICIFASCGTTPYQFASFASQIPLPAVQQDNETLVAGNLANYSQGKPAPTNTPPTNVTLKNTLTMRVDSANNLFLTSGAFYMIPVSSSGGLENVINVSVDGGFINPAFFEVFENGDDRIFIYVANGGLRTFTIPQISQISVNSPPKGLVSQALCLPGTFLKKVTSMAVTADQNLLIGDASNGRILEYYLRGANGSLSLQLCN